MFPERMSQNNLRQNGYGYSYRHRYSCRCWYRYIYIAIDIDIAVDIEIALDIDIDSSPARSWRQKIYRQKGSPTRKAASAYNSNAQGCVGLQGRKARSTFRVNPICSCFKKGWAKITWAKMATDRAIDIVIAIDIDIDHKRAAKPCWHGASVQEKSHQR